jgi:hypothetical protein
VAHGPIIFQSYVPKRIEVRVTGVGERVFAAEIHSQATHRTRLDWRRYDLDVTPHYPHALPREIEERCARLVAESGLVYGTIDLIARSDPRQSVAADLRVDLANAFSGQMIGPLETPDEWALLRVLSVQNAELTSAARTAVRNRIFREWLREQRGAARIEWFWGEAQKTARAWRVSPGGRGPCPFCAIRCQHPGRRRSVCA